MSAKELQNIATWSLVIPIYVEFLRIEFSDSHLQNMHAVNINHVMPTNYMCITTETVLSYSIKNFEYYASIYLSVL